MPKVLYIVDRAKVRTTINHAINKLKTNKTNNNNHSSVKDKRKFMQVGNTHIFHQHKNKKLLKTYNNVVENMSSLFMFFIMILPKRFG